MDLSAEDYRRGALERLGDAAVLLSQQRWSGAAYAAGRSVESMLRSLVRLRSNADQSGHDLRDLLKRAAALGLTLERDQDVLLAAVNRIAVIWHNNLRYADPVTFQRHLKSARKDRGVRGDAVEYWAKRLVRDCESVIHRGDLIWTRLKKK